MKRHQDQLTFNLATAEALGLDNYYISDSNKLAVKLIDKWRSWTNRKLILLGPTASGKSHLANYWATESGAVKLSPSTLFSKDVIEISRNKAILIEDLDDLLLINTDESSHIQEALFHLLNTLSQSTCYLLITGCPPLSSWPISIPDLFSRLKSYASVNLMQPDDTLLTAVMIKQFEDKQIKASPELIAFVSKRIKRTFSSVRDFVDLIDELTLKEKREVTIPVASMVIDRLVNIEKADGFEEHTSVNEGKEISG